VYGGRPGNVGRDDGYRYRGGGLVQPTGRASDADGTIQVRQGHRHAPDFMCDPDAVNCAACCLQVAAAAWPAKECNALADREASFWPGCPAAALRAMNTSNDSSRLLFIK
jgi:predicted chitinase